MAAAAEKTQIAMLQMPETTQAWSQGENIVLLGLPSNDWLVNTGNKICSPADKGATNMVRKSTEAIPPAKTKQ